MQARRVFLRGTGALAAAAVAPVALRSIAQTEERVIAVTAKKFEFSPQTIELRAGESAIIELMSLDITMGFKCPDLNLRADILPQVKTTVRVAAAKPGRYDFFCDVFCGEGHEQMDGVIVVAA